MATEDSAPAGSIDFQWRGEVPHVVLQGDIDFQSAQLVDDATLGRYQTEGVLVVDLGRVTFLDSTGISLLLSLRQIAGEVRLDDLPLRLQRMLEITGVESLFSYGGAGRGAATGPGRLA